MIKTFTQTDLIRYIYHETSEAETKEIDKALICDNALQALYLDLIAQHKELDDAALEPPPSAILNILSYAKSLPEKQV